MNKMEKQTNYFEELAKININDKVQKKGNFPYLSWAHAWAQFKLKHADANRKVYEWKVNPQDESGRNYFDDGKTAWVKVGTCIEGYDNTRDRNPLGQEHIDQLPITDFRNQSIKIEKITSMDVNTSIQRSTAKSIAMHGLGLSLWVGEDIRAIGGEDDVVIQPKVTKAVTKATLTLKSDKIERILSFIADNKSQGLSWCLEQIKTKYNLTPKIEKTFEAEFKKLQTK